MLTSERVWELVLTHSYNIMTLARAVEREATAELRAENERLRLEMQAACTSLCPHGLDIAAQKENAERKLRELEAERDALKDKL